MAGGAAIAAPAEAARGMMVTEPGLSIASGDLRYIRRFVTVAGAPVLAGDTRSQVNGAGVTEVVLENPAGPVQGGGIPPAIAPIFLTNLDGARFNNRMLVVRAGGTPPFIYSRQSRGTLIAPAQSNSGDTSLTIQGGAFDNAGGISVTANIDIITREAPTATAWGGLVDVKVIPIGTTTLVSALRAQAASATVAEWTSGAATIRVRPAAAGQWAVRDPADTANVIEVNPTGLGFFNVAPIARPTIVGARGGNAAVASIAAQGALLGLWIDGTTP